MSNLVDKIKEFIFKNKDVIQDRPEILINLKNKLAKAYGEDDEDDFNFDEIGHQDYLDEDDGYSDDEDLQGLTVMDEDEMQGDEADQWLQEQEATGQQEEVPAEAEVADEAVSQPAQEQKKRVGRWKPNVDNYEDHHHEKINELINEGFSHREAERMVNAHAGPNDFMSAYSSSHDIEEPSDSFLNILRPAAEQYVSNWNEHRLKSADAAKNPELYETAKVRSDFKDHHKGFEDAWTEHKTSDEYSALSRREKSQARKQFRENYMKENPDHVQSFVSMDAGGHRKQAQDQYHQNFNEQLEHLLSVHGPREGQMTSQEAGQHLGGEKTESGGYTSGQVKDPMAAFAEKNPHMREYAKQKILDTEKYKNVMSPEQHDRLKRVSTFKASKPKTPTGEGGGEQ